MTFTPYSNTGPFNNNAVPALAATFFNNVENFLDTILAPVVNDSHVTADGSGNVTSTSIKGVLKSVGGGHTLTDWNFGFQGSVNNAGVTITHGLKNAAGVASTPNAIFALIDNFALGEVVMADTAGTTTFRLSTNTANLRNVWWIALLA